LIFGCTVTDFSLVEMLKIYSFLCIMYCKWYFVDSHFAEGNS